MSLIRQLYSGILIKPMLDGNMSTFEWILIRMGWRLEIDDLTTSDNMYDKEEKITIVIQP